MWTWVIIVAGYGFSALFLRLIGGFNSAGDAIANWGRRSAARRLENAGQSPGAFVRSRLRR